MIKEDYVSFETAKLLKEKGFDWEVHRSYLMNDNCFAPADINDLPYRKDALRIPTLQMARKWLREVHTIDIVITPSMFRRKYNVCIFKDENLCCVDFDGATLSSSYEKACDAAIKYCLENLI
jgi:hypothetical protein